MVHPQACDLLEERQDALALAEAVHHHRQRGDVHAVGGHVGHVRGDPVELGHQHAYPLGPRGHVDTQQRLGGHREDQLVEERRQVVHAGDVGGTLEIGEVFAGLLHAGVQVADHGLAPQHRLALELDHDPQHAVGAGVLRPHVDDHRLVVGGLIVEGLGHTAQHGASFPAELGRARAVARLQLLRALVGLALEIVAHRHLSGLDIS